MTQEEIIQYNKRCAEFLGYTLRENDCYNGDDKLVAKLSFLQTADLKFHSDWNWIMEVVEAIEKLGHTVDIWNNVCVIPHLKKSIGESKKEAVVEAINQFLIWYNNEKSN